MRISSGLQSIRSRLFRLIMLVAFLPATVISAASLGFGYYAAHRSAAQRLEALASQTETVLTYWADSVVAELTASLSEPFVLERAQVILNLAKDDIYYDYYQVGAERRIQRYISGAQWIERFFLLDKNGKVILAVPAGDEGANFAQTAYFQRGKDGTEIEINSANLALSSRIAAFSPVVDLDGAFLGVIAATVKESTLTSLLADPGIETQHAIYLLDSNQQRIDAAGFSTIQPSEETTGNPAGFDIYRNQEGDLVYGVRRWIASPGMTLIVEQDYASVFGGIFTSLLVNLAVILAGLLLTGWAAVTTSHSIAGPLGELAEHATRIADGDFSQPPRQRRQDEIGALADAFHRMTAQLQNSIATLEQRVAERTTELQESTHISVKRALQLETSQQISQEITSILNIDELLLRVVGLIRNAFGYSYVALYLFNESTRNLVWRSGSDAGKPEDHSLPLDESTLNGRAAIRRQPVLIKDTQPIPGDVSIEETAKVLSELAIPLVMGDDLVGTLEVRSQSSEISLEDIRVLQGLGDQIVIAIQNARLYNRSKDLAVLEERNRLARDLHDSISQLLYGQMLYARAGRRMLSDEENPQLTSYLDQLHDTAHQALKEMRLMIYELRSPVLESQGLVGALQHRLEMVEQRSGIQVDFRAADLGPLPPEVEADLFGIIQESLNNALKHSRARSVQVTIECEGDMLRLLVADDGAGFEPNPERAGLGLQSMQERAARLGGRLDILSMPGCGAQVALTMRRAHA